MVEQTMEPKGTFVSYCSLYLTQIKNFILYLCIISSYITLNISAANCIVDTGDGFDVLFKRKSNNLNIFENKARSLNIKNCQVMSGFEMNGGSNKIQVWECTHYSDKYIIK